MNENELSQCLSRAEKRIQWLTLATLALLGITAALSFDWIQRFRGQQRIRAQGIDIGDGNYTTSIAGGFIVVTNDRENNSVYLTTNEIGLNTSRQRSTDGRRHAIKIGSLDENGNRFPHITIFDADSEIARANFGSQELEFGEGVRKTLPASSIVLFDEHGKVKKLLP